MTVHKTEDGFPIHVGMRVFGYDWIWGTVTAEPRSYDEDGWYEVTLDTGKVTTYNGTRMVTRAPKPGYEDPTPKVKIETFTLAPLSPAVLAMVSHVGRGNHKCEDCKQSGYRQDRLDFACYNQDIDEADREACHYGKRACNEHACYRVMKVRD